MSSSPDPHRPLDAFEARLLDDLQVYRSRVTVQSGRASERPTRTRPHLRLLAAGGGLLVAGGVAAAVVLSRTDATDLAIAGVACADRVEGQPNLAIAVSDGETPVALCTRLWRTGAVAGPTRTVPPLTACVAKAGSVVVYPAAAGVCARLGLATVPEGFEAASATFTAFRRAVSTRLDPAGAPCPDLDTAVRIVRAELARRHITGWSVRADRGTAGNCATIGFEPGSRTVVVSRL